MSKKVIWDNFNQCKTDEKCTKSLLFKPSVIQPISQTTYDLNSELLVCYSSHDLNNGPFKERTVLDHSNTKLVCYSDPHCT